jgi:hypothetical protein
MPTHVEGLIHGSAPDRNLSETDKVYVGVKYWDGATDKGDFLLGITHGVVLEHGGTEGQWSAFVLAATNGSTTDDLIEIMVDETWAQELLWVRWYRYLGQ